MQESFGVNDYLVKAKDHSRPPGRVRTTSCGRRSFRARTKQADVVIWGGISLISYDSHYNSRRAEPRNSASASG